MKVAVVKYNAGNIRSVDYALKRLGVEAVITADKEELQSADKVIFPGVGEAETTMNHLKATGLDELIKKTFEVCGFSSEEFTNGDKEALLNVNKFQEFAKNCYRNRRIKKRNIKPKKRKQWLNRKPSIQKFH